MLKKLFAAGLLVSTLALLPALAQAEPFHHHHRHCTYHHHHRFCH